MKHSLFAIGTLVFWTVLGAAQKPVSFPVDGQAGIVQGDLYGKGEHSVLLVHGGPFNKESWNKQARSFADEGFLVLAIAFRGDGHNPDGSPGTFGSTSDNAQDVLASVKYLRSLGARTVVAIGASMGGDAVGEADAVAKRGDIEAIALLASSGGDFPERLTGRKLFIVAQDDANSSGRRLDEISKHYARTSGPKKLMVVPGSAHAQYLFNTDQGSTIFESADRIRASR